MICIRCLIFRTVQKQSIKWIIDTRSLVLCGKSLLLSLSKYSRIWTCCSFIMIYRNEFKFQTKITIDIIIVVVGNSKILFKPYPAVLDYVRVQKIHFALWVFICALADPCLGYRHAFCLELPQALCYVSANSKGSGEIALMRRLVWAFAGRVCNKYTFFMCWLKWKLTDVGYVLIFFQIVLGFCQKWIKFQTYTQCICLVFECCS